MKCHTEPQTLMILWNKLGDGKNMRLRTWNVRDL